MLGPAAFSSVTYRLFKLAPGLLEEGAEDYGQAVCYLVRGSRTALGEAHQRALAPQARQHFRLPHPMHLPLNVQGTVPGHPHSYSLDSSHVLTTGKWTAVDGNLGEPGRGRRPQGGTCASCPRCLLRDPAPMPATPLPQPLSCSTAGSAATLRWWATAPATSAHSEAAQRAPPALPPPQYRRPSRAAAGERRAFECQVWFEQEEQLCQHASITRNACFAAAA